MMIMGHFGGCPVQCVALTEQRSGDVLAPFLPDTAFPILDEKHEALSTAINCCLSIHVSVQLI